MSIAAKLTDHAIGISYNSAVYSQTKRVTGKVAHAVSIQRLKPITPQDIAKVQEIVCVCFQKD
mgnify:CR=1 FL=1